MERVATASYIHNNKNQCNKCCLFSPSMPVKCKSSSHSSLLIYSFKAMKLQEMRVVVEQTGVNISHTFHMVMPPWNLRFIFFTAL